MTETSARHSRMVREQIEAAGGHVFKTVGEAFRAVFADPAAALASAAAVQRAIATAPWPPGLPIRVRMALHSGACVERDQASADGSAGPLSEREREIVALLAGGATGAVRCRHPGRLRRIRKKQPAQPPADSTIPRVRYRPPGRIP